MTTYPINELIPMEIVTRLKRIRITNGFALNVVGVVRPDRNASWTPEDGLIVLVQDDETPNEELIHPGNPPAIAFDVTYKIHCFVRKSDFLDSPYSTDCNIFAAQVKKAIVNPITDPGLWYQMAGNAINSTWGPTSEYDSSDGSHSGVTLQLNVIYRVSETDPYVVRA